MVITAEKIKTFCLMEVRTNGSVCTTALSRVHRYLHREYCLTPPTSLCSDNIQICTDQQWNGFQNTARIQNQRLVCWQHTKHFDTSQKAKKLKSSLPIQSASCGQTNNTTLLLK